jgi:hypothetical protein
MFLLRADIKRGIIWSISNGYFLSPPAGSKENFLQYSLRT